MTAPLILVDGSSYFFRAFHALPPLTNSKGQPTGAVYGVVNMVKRLMKDYQSERFAVVFDAKGKTFRDEWYPEYKANRAAMPVDLANQFHPMLNLLQAMGLPLLIIDGVEADDVIGTIARLATEKGQAVVISTGDKDMAQLVNEHVTLINTMSNQSLSLHNLKEKYGVHPHQFLDYLTLIGDTVDNVPGVPKCGPKTAIKWLEQYQSLDNILANAHEINGKIGEHLRASIAHLPLSKRLLTIKTDVELSVGLDDLQIKAPDKEALIALVKDLEFKTWLKELLNAEDLSSAKMDKPINRQVNLVTTTEQLTSWVNRLAVCKQACLAVKTADLDLICGQLVGLGLCIEVGDSAYIPIAHQDGSSQLDCEVVLKALKPFLENEAILKIGKNLKSDYQVLKNHDIQLKGIAFDTMLESYVLNSVSGKHDLDSLALKYLGNKIQSYEDIAGKGVKQRRFDQLTVAETAPYVADEMDATLKVHECLYALLPPSLKKVFHDIEMPLLTVLAEMERCGILIDLKKLALHGERLKARLVTLDEEACQLAGRTFNLNSPKQLQEVLFDEQQLPILAKTPTGQPSTAESVLQELAYDYRLPAVILEFRSLSKLVSTYIDALPKRENPKSQRIHTTYNQAVTATGRLSSSEPNIQNIPIRSEEGRLIRTTFVARPDYLILAADYSQIELRIMAHLSGDDNLVNAFVNGWDIHAATASEVLQIPLDQVSAEQRRRAKATNFGLIYGMSAFGLSKQLGIERDEAQQYINEYFNRYPGVLNYMEKTRKQAHQQGYVETLFGRRLYLAEISSQNLMRRRAAERMAINAPMQGTAADIIKRAMLVIAQWQASLPQQYAHMIMQVHDELVFEVHKDKISEVSAVIKNMMEETTTLSVPLLVSVGVGANWDEAH